MKNLLKNSKSLLVVAALGLSLTASAQEENKTKLSGSVDGYFRFTQGRATKSTNTYFTQSHNSFEIGSANVRAEHSRGKAKFLVDLGAGKRIDVINANDLNKTSSAVLIKELNVSFELLSDLTVTAGTFQRHFGIERIDAIENNNYSMSYIFTNSPLLNTGIKVNYKVDEFNVMIGISNATGFKSAIDSNTKDKTYFGQIGYTLDKTKVSLNTQFASNNSNNQNYVPANSVNYGLLNLTVKHELNAKVALALDGNFKRQTNDIKGGPEGNVIGVAGYVNYTVKENLGLAYRLEFFDDQKGISELIGKGNVFSNTLSANYKIGNLNIVPELRGDWDSAYNFGGKRYNVAGLVAAVYKF